MSVFPIREHVPSVYRSSVVVDLLYNMIDTAENVTQARRAGLTAMQHSVTSLYADLDQALVEFTEIRNFIDEHAKELVLALRGDDVRMAKTSGRLAVIMGWQNPKPLRDEIAYVRTFYELGLRVLMLTHNTQNYLGTGCTEPDNGLTLFGRKVVAECNRLGIMIDVAHCGPRTTLDAIECSEHPILCTHANPRGLVENVRNKSDMEIERLAAKGGVIGIASWAPLVHKGAGGRPNLDDVLDCFDYALKLVGPEHVAIGSDTNESKYRSMPEKFEAIYGHNGIQSDVVKHLPWYNLETWYAEGLESVNQLPDLAHGLLDRGHDEQTVHKVLGANVLRVFDRVCGELRTAQ